MRKLILFDIDGTLIKFVSKDHAGHYKDAIKNLHEEDVQVEGRSFSGYTDQLILSTLLEEAGWSSTKIASHMPSLKQEVVRVFSEQFIPSAIILLPGVKELLHELKQRGVTIALLTGNLEAIAKVKLDSFEIYDLFEGGGFGSDPHVTRGDLVTLAIEKAGFSKDMHNVYLAGDTPRDVQAGIDAAVPHKIMVATGRFNAAELQEAGADVALQDFSDLQATLRAFDIL